MATEYNKFQLNEIITDEGKNLQAIYEGLVKDIKNITKFTYGEDETQKFFINKVKPYGVEGEYLVIVSYFPIDISTVKETITLFESKETNDNEFFSMQIINRDSNGNEEITTIENKEVLLKEIEACFKLYDIDPINFNKRVGKILINIGEALITKPFKTND